MALVLDNDQILLRNTAVDFARARLPVTNLRSLRDSHDPTGFDREAWREMADLGWTGMLIPEELGGNGFGYFGLGLVMEALGAQHNKDKHELMLEIMGQAALGWAGPPFATEEIEISHNWLRSKGNSIEGGTSEIQLNIVAKQVLGLPE